MTSDAQNRFDSSAAEERDALASAYALGELEGAERDAVERLLADPAAADARRVVAETRAVAAALRAAHVNDAPPSSAALRRAVVAALAAAPPSPTATTRSGRSRLSGWLALAGALAAAVLMAVTLVPSVRMARVVARRGADERSAMTADAPAPNAAPVDALARSAAPEAEKAGGLRVTADAAIAIPEAAAPAASGRRQLAPPGPPGLARTRDLAARASGPAAAAPTIVADDLNGVALPMPGEQLAIRDAAGIEAFGGRPESRDSEALRRDADDRRADRERYGRFDENRFVNVADRPLSTFSTDVDTASYAVVRRFLASGRLPPADAVRIEELVNYFPYAYPQPAGDEPFAVALEATDCPWRDGHRIVRIGIAGRDIDRGARPAGNLVFLVDVSGSMDEPDKLPLVKQALALLVEKLSENDRVSIVTYAGEAGLRLPPTSGDQRRRILDVIEGLVAGGSTHGSAGIELAYEQAREKFIPGGANRVILCTDGDLNVGVTSDAALVDLVQEKARGGTFLTVLGFGRGNLQDEKLEALADKGNGIYAYVDGVREARKVLVEQLTGSTITIAKDVKIQVEFNPAQVASYRLIGYENRRLADADFRDDAKDAGEIGAGHRVTALYEIVPAGRLAAADGPARGAEPLKYAAEAPPAHEPAPAVDGPVSRELLTVKLRFKQPEGDESALREFPLADAGGAFAEASTDTRFAAAVAAFGMILRGSEFRGEATLSTVTTIALDALGTDEGGYRAEFLDLVRRAESLRIEERR